MSVNIGGGDGVVNSSSESDESAYSDLGIGKSVIAGKKVC